MLCGYEVVIIEKVIFFVVERMFDFVVIYSVEIVERMDLVKFVEI